MEKINKGMCEISNELVKEYPTLERYLGNFKDGRRLSIKNKKDIKNIIKGETDKALFDKYVRFWREFIIQKKMEKSAITIQQFYKNKQWYKISRKIFKIYVEWYSKLFKIQIVDITIFEAAAGFSEGSYLRNFQQHFGKFMEKIYDVSPYYKDLPQNGLLGGNDGNSDIHNCLYEVKNKYCTMKGSQAYNEIKDKLEYAIQNNKKFILLICNDKNNLSRKIPLHKGQSLSRINTVEGYDPTKHLWFSGDKVYEHLFKSSGLDVKNYILALLKHKNSN